MMCRNTAMCHSAALRSCQKLSCTPIQETCREVCSRSQLSSTLRAANYQCPCTCRRQLLLGFPAASRTSTTTVLLPFPSDSSQPFACWQPSHPVNSRFSFAKRQLPTPASVSLNETARVTERLNVDSVLAFANPAGLSPSIATVAFGRVLSSVTLAAGLK